MKRFLLLFLLALPAEAQYQHLRWDYGRSMNSQADAVPLQVALKAVASSTFSGTLSSGSFTAPDAGCYRFTTDSFICRYAAKQVSITGDGTGQTTNAGLVFGYAGTSNYAGIWGSAYLVGGGAADTNKGLLIDASGNILLRGVTSAELRANNAGGAVTVGAGVAVTGSVLSIGSASTALSEVSAGILGCGTGAAGSTACTLRAQVVGTPTGYAIASLPTAVAGDRTFVTDQITACAAIGVAPTAGGALKCPVFYNGTAWVGG